MSTLNANIPEVGISELPNQIYKKILSNASKHNEQILNLMIVGESGLGKTTFINTLFQTTLKERQGAYDREGADDFAKKNGNKTTSIEITRCQLEEKNFTLNVNLIDTPGYGDFINNTKAWLPLCDFIDEQYDHYMRQEQQPFRDSKFDLRVHAIIFFIKPTNGTLKPLDVITMRELSKKGNLIPVISKSDTLTRNELTQFKSKIRNVIEEQNIQIFTPPIFEESSNAFSGSVDEDTVNNNKAAIQHAKQLIESMPFAIIGSEEQYELNGNKVYGRKYPWGLIEVENEAHCDFRKLRSLLLRTNLLDLIHSTHNSHYEYYRKQRLQVNSAENNNNGINILPAPVRKMSHNPRFKEEELALKRYFTEQVKVEEQRFRQWEQNIVNERIRLNNDLEEEQNKVKKLEDQIRALQMKTK
ncbi:hypothetical protein QEN19_002391 [Hanseniaspora menglaensis]